MGKRTQYNTPLMSKNTNTIGIQSISMPILHTSASYYNSCLYSNGAGKAHDTFQHSLVEQENQLQVYPNGPDSWKSLLKVRTQQSNMNYPDLEFELELLLFAKRSGPLMVTTIGQMKKWQQTTGSSS